MYIGTDSEATGLIQGQRGGSVMHYLGQSILRYYHDNVCNGRWMRLQFLIECPLDLGVDITVGAEGVVAMTVILDSMSEANPHEQGP